jgi:cytochrome c oxidase subunit II
MDYLKYLVGLFLISIIAVAGCSGQVEEQSSSSEANSLQNEQSSPAVGTEVVEIQVTAKQWEFVPDTITVNRGDDVRLSIESIDVNHGIAIPDFGVNAFLKPGEVTDVEFVASKTGTFSFFCSVQCGQGHGSMRGTLIVK